MFKRLNWLFTTNANPVGRFEDDFFGPLIWSEDDEAWSGQRDGLAFLLAYDGQVTPSGAVRTYARAMLEQPAKLYEALERAKQAALRSYPSSLAVEIQGLQYGTVCFAHLKHGPYIIAGLEGGLQNHSWRIEFHGEVCDGLGFDT